MPHVVVHCAELCAVLEGLLVVVADDLVELECARADCLEPRRMTLVEFSARLLRSRPVRCISDQQVSKGKGPLAGEHGPVGAHELLVDERRQRRAHTGRICIEELGDGRLVKDLALYRSRLDRRVLVVGETVESFGQEGLDSRWYFEDTPDAIVFEQERDHLLDKERVSIRAVDNLVSRWLVQLDGTAEVVDQLHALGLGQRLEEDRGRIRPPATPLRPDLVKLGPCDADEEQRCVVRPLGDVVDEVEKRRLAPVDVVEDEDERTTACQRLEERAHRPEAFVRAAHVIGEADRPPQAAGRQRPPSSTSSSSAASLARLAGAESASSRSATSRIASSTGQ